MEASAASDLGGRADSGAGEHLERRADLVSIARQLYLFPQVETDLEGFFCGGGSWGAGGSGAVTLINHSHNSKSKSYESSPSQVGGVSPERSGRPVESRRVPHAGVRLDTALPGLAYQFCLSQKS